MATLFKPNAILTRPVRDVEPEAPAKERTNAPAKKAGAKKAAAEKAGKTKATPPALTAGETKGTEHE